MTTLTTLDQLKAACTDIPDVVLEEILYRCDESLEDAIEACADVYYCEGDDEVIHYLKELFDLQDNPACDFIDWDKFINACCDSDMFTYTVDSWDCKVYYIINN